MRRQSKSADNIMEVPDYYNQRQPQRRSSYERTMSSSSSLSHDEQPTRPQSRSSRAARRRPSLDAIDSAAGHLLVVDFFYQIIYAFVHIVVIIVKTIGSRIYSELLAPVIDKISSLSYQLSHAGELSQKSLSSPPSIEPIDDDLESGNSNSISDSSSCCSEGSSSGSYRQRRSQTTRRRRTNRCNEGSILVLHHQQPESEENVMSVRDFKTRRRRLTNDSTSMSVEDRKAELLGRDVLSRDLHEMNIEELKSELQGQHHISVAGLYDKRDLISLCSNARNKKKMGGVVDSSGVQRRRRSIDSYTDRSLYSREESSMRSKSSERISRSAPTCGSCLFGECNNRTPISGNKKSVRIKQPERSRPPLGRVGLSELSGTTTAGSSSTSSKGSDSSKDSSSRRRDRSRRGSNFPTSKRSGREKSADRVRPMSPIRVLEKSNKMIQHSTYFLE